MHVSDENTAGNAIKTEQKDIAPPGPLFPRVEENVGIPQAALST